MPRRIGDDVRRWRRPQPPRALRVATYANTRTGSYCARAPAEQRCPRE